MTKKTDLVELSEEQVEQKIKKFDTLLNQIEGLADKKKELWRQIYNNAQSDRHNAFILFEKLYKVCVDEDGEMKSTEMAVHGKTLKDMLAQMSKSTDQLGKLADLLQNEEDKAKRVNVADAYDAIGELEQK